MVGQAVKGVILDDSVLFINSKGHNPNPSLRPVADVLLRHLRHSMFRTVSLTFPFHSWLFFFSIWNHVRLFDQIWVYKWDRCSSFSLLWCIYVYVLDTLPIRFFLNDRGRIILYNPHQMTIAFPRHYPSLQEKMTLNW